ncbi:MAG: HD domain-containing protein [Chloroflexota bacterium]
MTSDLTATQPGSTDVSWDIWEDRFASFLSEAMSADDSAHDLSHIHRVVATARHLAAEEGANLTVVLPAAWLHDCVSVPKDSPDRPRASRMAAKKAGAFLRASGYPPEAIPAIEHAIAAHSFTAGIEAESLEAKVVQDADRLDSIGAIGIARCFSVGGLLKRPIYYEPEPLPVERQPEDVLSSVDHFYTKLFKLESMMQTEAGRKLAAQRTAVMRTFLQELSDEIGGRR